jgi:hypothetical protein
MTFISHLDRIRLDNVDWDCPFCRCANTSAFDSSPVCTMCGEENEWIDVLSEIEYKELKQIQEGR